MFAHFISIFSLGTAKLILLRLKFDNSFTRHLLEFKDSDQTHKGIDVDIINKVAEIKGWNIQMSYPGFDAAMKCARQSRSNRCYYGR